MQNSPVRAEQRDLPRFLVCGDLTLDYLYRDVRIDTEWVRLSPREFDLVWYLVGQSGNVVSTSAIWKEVWRDEPVPNSNSIAVHISRIRTKLRAFDLDKSLITHRGRGYSFVSS